MCYLGDIMHKTGRSMWGSKFHCTITELPSHGVAFCQCFARVNIYFLVVSCFRHQFDPAHIEFGAIDRLCLKEDA
jgi:hypothetical protein